ncbi:MAG: SUMF1/EgtB/PvdO family nonheme iron enzyme [Deltaproteobacteria bacterium]|nr:SUMF1/EgtB/PvdO family nonheme iron enzyme [Deltaproteobacteria bacterium]
MYCSLASNGCLDWNEVTDCTYFGQACDDSDKYARCVAICEYECETAGATRCSGDIVQTCSPTTDECIEWVNTYTCPLAQECNDTEGTAECVCDDMCTDRGTTQCDGTVIQTCSRDDYGCLYLEDTIDCDDSDLVCNDITGVAVCEVCSPDCTGRECGPDPVCHEICGFCEGATELCRDDEGICENVCADLECGTFEGIDCGECVGLTDVCRPATGLCEDVCLWRECGDAEGFDCGTCPDDENCLNGQCFTPACEGGMCLVPEGPFWMGCNEDVDLFCENNEYPYHEVYLDAFEINMFEVTQAEYFLCVLEGICEMPVGYFDPESHGDDPVVYMYWEGATAFCQWAGKRLCTEAEWEKAARGTDGRRYPWGNEPATCEFAVMNDGGDGCGTGGMMPVGSRPAGAGPFGTHDQAGNVWELVNDYYSETYYSECITNCSNPTGPSEAESDHGDHVVRGGDFLSWADKMRVSWRYQDTFWPSFMGFRCCRSVE